ncbi:MAG TPA: HAMP domain-containing protein [Methanospirillum sp.]|nr:HAMP domain-containing protein [Methanospirillum sp.]
MEEQSSSQIDNYKVFRSLYDELPIAFYQTTPQGTFQDVNSALVQLLGYPDRDSLILVSLPDLYVHPDTRIQWIEQIGQEGIVRNFEIQLIHHDGTPIWVKNTGKAFFDDAGQVIYYIGILEDISGRKHAEEDLKKKNDELQAANEELAATEQELRAHYQELIKKEQELRASMQRSTTILDAIPDIMFVLSDDGEFLDTHIPENPSSHSPMDQYTGKNIRNIGLTKETATIFQQKILLALESSCLRQFEYEQVFPGGCKYYEARLKTLNEHQVLVINRDITERKEQEKRLKSAISQIDQNMETLSALNDQIRNPLTIISTLTDEIDDDIAEKINHQIKIIDNLITVLDRGLVQSDKVRIFLMKHFVNPIQKLSEVASRVSMGDLQTEVDSCSEDEINELTESFKRMINAFKIMEAINVELLGDEEQLEKNRDYLLSHYVKPIQKLTDIANRVSMGDLQTKFEIDTSDGEIIDLAESFKRMINAFKMMEGMNEEIKGEEELSEKTQEYLMEHYVRPIQKLTDIANRVSMGDLQTKFEIDTSDGEIIDLAESFRRLINAFKIMEAINREISEKQVMSCEN